MKKYKIKNKHNLTLINNYIKEYKEDPNLKNFKETDNDSTIYVDLKKGDIYKEYSVNSLLNNGIFDFIESTFNLVDDKKKPLNIEFEFPLDMEENEKDRIIKLYKVHYANETKRAKKENTKDRIISLILLVFGFVLLGINIALKLIFKDNNPDYDTIFSEIIDIFAWVFIWECCDLLIFSTAKNNLKAAKYFRLFTANMVKN